MTTELTIEYGRKLLPYLVQVARTRKTVTYGELAAKIGANPHALSYPLGYVRDDICISRGLPLITCIVINGKKGLPGSDWLPEGTSNLTDEEYKEAFEKFRDQVFAYSGWEDLLKELGLSPVKPTIENLDERGRAYAEYIKRTGKGEGEDHRQLKEYIASHPEAIGFHVRKPAIVEYAYISGDEADVVFELGKNEWIVVEVKNGDTGELIKGIYQDIKYRALLQAEKGHGIPVQVDAVLVAYQIPSEVSLFAAKLGIRCKIIRREQVQG